MPKKLSIDFFSLLKFTSFSVLSLLSSSNLAVLAQSTAPDNSQPTASNYLPTGNVLCPGGQCRVFTPSKFTGPGGIVDIVQSVGGVLVFVISSIAVLFMIWGAWDYMTDPDKGPENGRKKLINAAIAIAIAVLSFTITQIIVNVLNGWTATI